MGILAWSLLLFLAPQSEEVRLPVPSDDNLALAEKTIRDVFKEEYAIKTTPAQLKFARKLLDQGAQTKDDAALRYVLLKEAGELSILSGDADLLVQSIEQICRIYAVQSVPFRQSFLSRAEARLSRPEDFKKLAEALGRVALDAIDQDLFEAAGPAAQSALAVARKSKDIPLTSRADALLKSIPEQKAAFERVKKAEKELAANPEDAAARTVVGEYLSLTKGQWQEGLAHLAKGVDGPLTGLAVKELTASTDAVTLVELADGWWDAAEKEKSPLRKRQMLLHAAGLYERALPLLQGLSKVRIEKRLSTSGVGAAPVGARVKRDGLVAWWKFDEGKGTVSANAMGPGNQATLSNVEWAPGRMGSALKFNGTTSFVTCQPEGLPALNTPLTWSYWLYYAKMPTHGETAICMADKPATGGLQAGVRGGSGRMTLWKWSSSDIFSDPVKVDQWMHYAYVFDGTQHLLYTNGKLVSQSREPSSTITPTRCEFGRYWGAATEPFTGLLDDVRIYKRVLSDSEVQSLASGSD